MKAENDSSGSSRDPIDRYDFRHVHPNIEFGTASDRYAGWIGQIYSDRWNERISSRKRTLGGRKYEERQVPVESVVEYFEHFRVLELDFTFYRVLVEPGGDAGGNFFALQKYADEAPDNARFLLKAPQQVTARKLFRSSNGKPSWQDNADYLNREMYLKGFLHPAQELLGDRLQGVIFEQEYQRRNESPGEEEFVGGLSEFFADVDAAVPVDEVPTHLEIRSPHLLTKSYFDWLEDAGLGHVFSHWTWLPPIREQWDMCGGRLTSSDRHVVARLLTPLRKKYADAYALAHPFDSAVEEIFDTQQAKEMVLDTTALTIQALKHDFAATVILNNRAWGNAPAMGQVIARRVQEELDKQD
ncbi:MAG: DUF72 domain-containing protein [Rhodothermales bacterium]|nr:DUF72 domain-containing protein [Rhodothermales bacterium]